MSKEFCRALATSNDLSSEKKESEIYVSEANLLASNIDKCKLKKSKYFLTYTETK